MFDNNKYQKQWRIDNRDRYREIRDKANEKKTAEYRQRFTTLKLGFGCMNPNCKWSGEFEACQLEFHHLDPNSKYRNVAQLVRRPSKMRAEILKCTCLCSNCHRAVEHGDLDDSTLPRCELNEDK